MYRRGVKRHPALIPLSHDHHDALVVARGLILGRATAPRSDWPPDRRAQVDRVTAFFSETLRAHFEADPTSALAQRLPALGKLLESHIRTEERIVFEAMQQELGPAELEAVGAALARLPPRGPSCRISSEPA